MNTASLTSDLPPPVKISFQYNGVDSRVAYLFCLNAHITAICTSKNKPRLKLAAAQICRKHDRFYCRCRCQLSVNNRIKTQKSHYVFVVVLNACVSKSCPFSLILFCVFVA